MLDVKIPRMFQEEIKYTLEILMIDFLGLDINYIASDDEENICIKVGDNSLVLKNAFFSKFSNQNDYLKVENLPNEVIYSSNQFISENDIPILFGNENIIVEKNQIICDIDIIASTFFMLSRWEEYVNKKRDKHNRFPASESVAYKNNFLHRPIVNEYTELLWNMLEALGIDKSRKKFTYKMVVTHDVDSIYYLKTSKQLVRAIGGDVLKRKNIVLGIKRFGEYRRIKKDLVKDPYDTFDWIMDLSEKNGLQSEFYFMSGGTSSFDNRYEINDDITMKLLNNIQNRGHVIGFHPSYNAYNDSTQWHKEVSRLNKAAGKNIEGGRHHYLRFEIPTTWQIWEDNNMKYDSTLGYAEELGFRCGVCYEYNVFNILTRKKLKLKEKPLVIMEVTLANYKNLSPNIMLEQIQEYIKKCKKYSGEFVFLWHNSNLNDTYWSDYKYVYEKIINTNTES